MSDEGCWLTSGLRNLFVRWLQAAVAIAPRGTNSWTATMQCMVPPEMGHVPRETPEVKTNTTECGWQSWACEISRVNSEGPSQDSSPIKPRKPFRFKLLHRRRCSFCFPRGDTAGENSAPESVHATPNPPGSSESPLSHGLRPRESRFGRKPSPLRPN